MVDTAYHQDAEGEESYYVSMTDIMVGMVFVFIILLMYFVFQIQTTHEPTVPLSQHREVINQKERAEVGLENAKKTIKDLEEQISQLKKNALNKYLADADKARTQILEDLQRSMREAGITVQIIPEQGVLRLPESLLFASGKSQIDQNSKEEKAVKALSHALTKVLPCFSVGPKSDPVETCNPNGAFIEAIFVEGHTDNVPILGEIEAGIIDNLSLSARRATNTVRVAYAVEPILLELYSISPSQEGVALGHGTSPLLNAAAYGDTRPAFTNNDEEGRSRNRRIDLRLLMYAPRSDSLAEVYKLVGH